MEIKKITKKELQQLIIVNFYDSETNTIDISGLDFSNKIVWIHGLTAKKISQGYHKSELVYQVQYEDCCTINKHYRK